MKPKTNKAIPCSSLSLDRSIQSHHPYQSYPFSFVDQNLQVTIDCKVRLHLKNAWPFAYSVSRGTDWPLTLGQWLPVPFLHPLIRVLGIENEFDLPKAQR